MFSPGALLSISVDSIVFCPTTSTKVYLCRDDLVVFLGIEKYEEGAFAKSEDEFNISLLTRLGVLRRRVAGRGWEKWFRKITNE